MILKTQIIPHKPQQKEMWSLVAPGNLFLLEDNTIVLKTENEYGAVVYSETHFVGDMLSIIGGTLGCVVNGELKIQL